ncbi:DUF4309 domain-containing protein [Paenibacillus radicis (ex Xue et al. 2023)]|uniref:DUF4309 domain-containing protein n=1 Tax=Paenibacillus radicis (ex Xue et al. 2023) TaxID=2972489 RepID=A0ABT1YD78_9BACL|nr:DUF4309 domain-containing protein [Paenibacillus radicis (ex Xue et al. 2023)]MCR8631150.1 DUF4309 domain-containing protein [Paenibacillus radicis (ex Xue et al. 2023)]
MIRQNKLIALWSIPLIFIMLLIGCKDTSTTLQSPKPGESHVQPPTAANVDVTHKHDAAEVSVPVKQTDNTPAIVNPSDKVSLASVEHNTQPDQETPDSKPAAAAKPKIDIQDPYNQAKPTLLGLTLNTSLEKVTAKYGKPKSQFVMEDDSDPITVYDYTDFLVGFNQKNLLQFIDIRSSDINPGLNGLKLGQSTNDVFKTLGKPDSNTSFVLTYKSTGAVLKLDIDPKTEKVNSIKLFAVE